MKYILICEHCGRLLDKPRLFRGDMKKFCYCNKHRKQLDRYGKFLDNNQYFRNDKNVIIEHEDYAEVILRDRLGNTNGIAYIDLEDVEFVKQYKWHIMSAGYMNCNELGLFHKIIVDFEIVDHINRNRLDNRRINLRKATNQENQINRSIQKNNTSGVTGVSYSRRDNKWIALLEKDGCRLINESFNNKEDAIICRLKGEKKYFGEFAPQKHLFKIYNI